MKIDDWEIRPYSIPFRKEFRTSGGLHTSREGLIVIARAEYGLSGVGDIAPLPGFSRESVEQAKSQTLSLCESFREITVPGDVPSLERQMDVHPDSFVFLPSVAFGFETALADLASKKADLPLTRWLNRDAMPRVPLNAILTGDLEEIEHEMISKRKMGYMAYKIKVGQGNLKDDIARIGLARKYLGENVSIRLDANRAWNFDQAIEALSRFRAFDIEYVEEPLQGDIIARISELFEACGVIVALDETVMEKARFQKLIEERAVGAVVIKPSVVGGLTKSIALSEKISALGKKIVISSLLESGVGVSACLHLAAALGRGISPCGLDTLSYLEESLIHEDLPVRDGYLEPTDKPGLGTSLWRNFMK